MRRGRVQVSSVGPWEDKQAQEVEPKGGGEDDILVAFFVAP